MTWLKLIKRVTEPLVIHMCFEGKSKYFSEVIGIDFNPKKAKYENGFLFLDKDEFEKEISLLREKHSNFFFDLANKISFGSDNLIKSVKSIIPDELKDKSNKELKEIFKKYVFLTEKYQPIMWVPHSIEIILTEIILNKLKQKFPKVNDEEINNRFNILATSKEEVTAIKEHKELLKLAIELKNNNNILSENLKEKLSNHYRKYFWLGLIKMGLTHLVKPFNEKYFLNKLKKTANRNPEEELFKIEKQKEEKIKKYNKFIEKIKDKELIRYSEILQKYMFLRTNRSEAWQRIMFLAKPLLVEIALRFNMKLEDIVNLIPSEIEHLLSIEEIKDNYYWEINDYLISFKPKPILKEKAEEIKVLKGTVASRGKAEGFVKIVNNKDDINKIKEGDILVTLMTSPYMTISMEKAAAIVTDEGGILCHAAIVSREMGIPCVIGTKIATKVLKDGDLVRVDAEKGIVEIKTGIKNES